MPDQSRSTFDLASRQASLAYERTFMSVDRTLMSVIHVSLSMIGFGFAMFLFFHRLTGEVGVDLRAPARNFGIFLVAIGIALVTAGLFEHRRRRAELGREIDALHRHGQLLHPYVPRRSPIALAAGLLLLAGLLVMVAVLVRMGPFA
ncbi:MAG TPA: DUF202 domain-containing protein [Allosphingosinicella sp.]|jgi:putative membrane protein